MTNTTATTARNIDPMDVPVCDPCGFSNGRIPSRMMTTHDDGTVTCDVCVPTPDYYTVNDDGTVTATDPSVIVVTTDDAPITPIGDMGLDGPYASADSIGYGLSIYYTADRCGVVVCIDYVGGPASAQPTADTHPLFVATVADVDHVMAAWRVASRWMADRVANDVDAECGIPTAAYRTVTR